jgi:hypothetical protein
MTSRHILLAGIVFLSAVTVSCNSTYDPSSSGLTAIGIITMSAKSSPNGYTTAPIASFFLVAGANFLTTANTTDVCTFSAFDPTLTSSFSTDGQAALAGGGIATTVSGHTDSLKVTSLQNFTYQLLKSTGIVFNPGDSIKFKIQGNSGGYPAFTITGRTAEPFTIGPIDLTLAANGIPITWSPAADTSSSMLINLQYASNSLATAVTQISCDVHDDGYFLLPANISQAYAAGAQQSISLQRLRTLVASPDGTQNYVNLISVFQVPTPTSP